MRTASVTAALVLSAAMAAAPLRAEPAGEADGRGADKPLSDQLEEAIRGLVESVEPTLEQLRDTFRVLERVDALENYQKPEILPNGDIIIRRKATAPPYEAPPDPEVAPEPDIRT